MNYKICKMKFQTEVHFGRGFLSDSEYSCYADTIFSALCHEYIKCKGVKKLEDFIKYFQEDSLFISDAFPYIKQQYYLPKPQISSKTKELKQKRMEKQIPYIPEEMIKNYFNGTFDASMVLSSLSELGISSVHVKASIHGLEEANPYWVGSYRFAEENGLYFLIGYKDKKGYDELVEAVKALSSTGIGGKVSSGYGSFEVTFEDVPSEWIDYLTTNERNQEEGVYMSLSISLPKNEELNQILEHAHYKLIRRGGFVADTHSQSNGTIYGKEQRKQDLYVFQAGSCHKGTYCGDIYDVSNSATHPVYRYAKPIFWRLNCYDIQL